MEYLAKYKTQFKLSRSTMQDIELWLIFFESATHGISITRVIFWKPTITTLSDASEAGIGGFCPKSGIAWRYLFTEEENKAFTLNAKEYITSVIDMDFHMEMDPNQAPFPCVFNMTDSTSANGWLCKSNHDPEVAPHPQRYCKIPCKQHAGTEHLQILIAPHRHPERCCRNPCLGTFTSQKTIRLSDNVPPPLPLLLQDQSRAAPT